MARIMTRRKAIPKAIELLQCLPQTEEVVEVIQALKKYSSTPLDRWDAASVYEALDEWTESHNGIPPRIKECDSHKELPSHMVFEKLFGKTAREFLNDYYGEMEYVRIGRHGTRCVDDQYDFLEIFKTNLNGYNQQRQKYMMLVEIQKHHHGERLQEDVKCLPGQSWLHCPV